MNRFFTLFLLVQLSAFQAFSQSRTFANHTELGPMVGTADGGERRTNFSFQTFNGVRLHPSHEVGFLVGVDTYPGFILMPLALGWRGIRDKGKRTSLYAGLDIGYGSTWLEKKTVVNNMDNWFQGGLLISPAVGIRIKSKKGTHSYSWSMGFKKQKASFLEGIPVQDLGSIPADSLLPPGYRSVWKESYIMNSLFLKWGVVF